MKKKKWIKIYLNDGTVKEIDYGWQSSQYLDNVVFTRVKDGKQEVIPIKSIKECIYNTI
jgi:hypothetical protein